MFRLENIPQYENRHYRDILQNGQGVILLVTTSRKSMIDKAAKLLNRAAKIRQGGYWLVDFQDNLEEEKTPPPQNVIALPKKKDWKTFFENDPPSGVIFNQPRDMNEIKNWVCQNAQEVIVIICTSYSKEEIPDELSLWRATSNINPGEILAYLTI